MTDRQTYGQQPGIIQAVTGLVRNFVSLVFNRMELAMLELSDLGTSIARLLVLVGVMIVLLWFAVASWAGLIVYLAWQGWGWQVLVLLGVLFTVLAAGLGWYIVRYVKSGRLSMPLTTQELRKDRAALTGEEDDDE